MPDQLEDDDKPTQKPTLTAQEREAAEARRTELARAEWLMQPPDAVEMPSLPTMK
jgi:hypothetical protein